MVAQVFALSAARPLLLLYDPVLHQVGKLRRNHTVAYQAYDDDNARPAYHQECDGIPSERFEIDVSVQP